MASTQNAFVPDLSVFQLILPNATRLEVCKIKSVVVLQKKRRRNSMLSTSRVSLLSEVTIFSSWGQVTTAICRFPVYSRC